MAEKIMIPVDQALIPDGYRAIGYRNRKPNEPFTHDARIDTGKPAAITDSSYLGPGLILEKIPPVMPHDMHVKLWEMFKDMPSVWFAVNASRQLGWYTDKPEMTKAGWSGGFGGILPRIDWTGNWRDSRMQLPKEPPKFEGFEGWVNIDSRGKASLHKDYEAAWADDGVDYERTFKVREVING